LVVLSLRSVIGPAGFNQTIGVRMPPARRTLGGRLVLRLVSLPIWSRRLRLAFGFSMSPRDAPRANEGGLQSGVAKRASSCPGGRPEGQGLAKRIWRSGIEWRGARATRVHDGVEAVFLPAGVARIFGRRRVPRAIP
jgi:hypothetical protein